MPRLTNGQSPNKPRTVKPAHGYAKWILAMAPTGFGILDISGTHYSVVRLGTAGFRLMKTDGTTYDLDTADAEYWQCSCPDYEFSRHQKDPRGCKHVCGLRAAIAHLEKTIKLPAPKPTPAYRSAADMASNEPEAYDVHAAAVAVREARRPSDAQLMAGRAEAYPDGDPIDSVPVEACACGSCELCGYPADEWLDERWELADSDPQPAA